MDSPVRPLSEAVESGLDGLGGPSYWQKRTCRSSKDLVQNNFPIYRLTRSRRRGAYRTILACGCGLNKEPISDQILTAKAS
jgi:hypothetical protein